MKLTKLQVFTKSRKFKYEYSTKSMPVLSERFRYAQSLLNTNVIEVKDFGGKGLGLVSTDDIPKNEIIFQEKPYAFVPSFQERGLTPSFQCRVTFEELTRNTPLENKKEVLILSKLLEEKMKRNTKKPNQSNNAFLEEQVDLFLNSESHKGEKPENLTMAKLMINIYQKMSNDFTQIMKEPNQNAEAALIQSTKVINNFMSVMFDESIKNSKMPLLSFQEKTQIWLKKHYQLQKGNNNDVNNNNEMFEKFPSLLEYQDFIKYYVKVNLNHFSVTVYSHIAIDLFGFRPALTLVEEEEFKRQTGNQKLTSNALFNEWLDYGINHNLLFGTALGVYPLSALMNHHCNNNVELKHSTNDQLLWVAKRDIPKDTELTISYCGEGSYEERQNFLLGHHYFKCPCASDSDCMRPVL
jgi:hypothetical protein